MKILLCCEHFFPQVGGVGKMMQEIGHRLVILGHSVDVVSSFTSARRSNILEGMQITSFKVSGNAVSGMRGEVEAYQNFLISGGYDCLIVMAAQQWTLDAMIPVLDKIKYKKIHIPCGYSGLYASQYRDYFEQMKLVLPKFNLLIFNSSDYRDINYAKEIKHPNISVIPAGASEFEFEKSPGFKIREELNIGPDDFIFLSVGAPAYHKGHKETLNAYLESRLDFNSVLVLNGNYDQNISGGYFSRLKECIQRIRGVSPWNIKKLASKNLNPKKKIIFSNLEREKLISLFFEADLFLFTSHIEYSPLVIYEGLAAGLPFLSVPVGNVPEIAKWSGGGEVCHDVTMKNGRTFVNYKTFARHIENLCKNQAKLKRLGEVGRNSWKEKFNWMVITKQILEKAINC
jgi:glycosyltransferase involved in cell wall biosynthesis